MCLVHFLFVQGVLGGQRHECRGDLEWLQFIISQNVRITLLITIFYPSTFIGFDKCIDGIYDPLEELYNNCTVYKKRESDSFIEYRKERRWAICTSSTRGTNKCSAYIDVLLPQPLDRVISKGGWVLCISDSDPF